MKEAFDRADGRKIDGRRVLVDVERGRTVKGWRPRSALTPCTSLHYCFSVLYDRFNVAQEPRRRQGQHAYHEREKT